MRCTASIVNVHGKPSSKRGILPGGFVRMDDDEKFRLLFENDWKNPVTVFYVFDRGEVQCIEGIEEGELVPSPETYVFERTPPGQGRLVEVRFIHPTKGPIDMQFMLMNNDYDSTSGAAVHYGDMAPVNLVKGRAVRKEDDPDIDQRAN